MPSTNKLRSRLAFGYLYNTEWVAGTYYLENLLAALKLLAPTARPETVLLVAPTDAEIPLHSRVQVDQVLVVPAVPLPLRWLRYRLARLRNSSVDWIMSRLMPVAWLAEHRVDCIFARWDFGPTFGIPLISWIPDFQQLHLPDMFSPAEIQGRNTSFALSIAYSDRIVLSSEHARRDMEQFAPRSADKARLLSFVAQVPASIYATDSNWVCQYYHLPEKFFFLPNQFWKHKNHTLVAQALALLKRSDMTVVCTGNVSDYRNARYFSEWLAEISKSGLRDQMVLLGMVPREHVFHLIRQSVAVLQPSLFEGWSSTVEEVKSLGKQVILSDIPVHREQKPPQSIFFDPHDSNSLAECLARVWADTPPGPDRELETQARADLPERTVQFGRTLMQVVNELI